MAYFIIKPKNTIPGSFCLVCFHLFVEIRIQCLSNRPRDYTPRIDPNGSNLYQREDNQQIKDESQRGLDHLAHELLADCGGHKQGPVASVMECQREIDQLGFVS